MVQELTGLEYLRKKEIKNMKCDMEKPFAFISYSHDDYDSQIVMNVFKQLMDRGHNLWIDTANMPADEHTWKKSARDALRNRNCKLAFFFRSESSMVKETIAKELKTIILLKHIKSIVTLDIWHEDGMDADTYYAEVMNDESKDIDSCDRICECVSTECKAIRLAGDAGNDILNLAEEMEEELKAIESITTDSSGGDIVIDNGEDESDEDDADDEVVDETDSDNEDESQSVKAIKETVQIVSHGNIFHTKGRDGYHYYIFGVEYYAGRREQANLMYDTFNALTNKHPEKVMDIAEKCTSVSKKDDVSDAGTRNAKPPYFRMCKEYTVSGVEYVVGSSYGFEAKIAEIYRMIDACGDDRSVFELEGFEQKKKKDKTDSTRRQSEKAQNAEFEYTLWGILHTANKMSDMMHDVFDLIAEKYSDKISDIAASDSISSVARKEDVEGHRLPPGKLNYFRSSREHCVGKNIYYVGTSYNRSQGIGQLERMLKICEGNTDGFKITSSPERISHSGGKTGKKGIGELI